MLRAVKGLLLFLLTVVLSVTLFFVWNHVRNKSLEITSYRIFSDKIDEPVRAVFLSDLHQASFGEENAELTDAVASQQPDVILIGGDMVNDERTNIELAVNLCAELAQIAPVYYGMGNHENKAVYGINLYEDDLEAAGVSPQDAGDFSQLVRDDSLFRGLEAHGVTVLQNTSASVEINGNRLLIGGVSTSVDAFWPYSGDFFMDFTSQKDAGFKILISHFPSTVSRYMDGFDVDLALSGHNHGGIVRIPGFGGLLSYDEGWFPSNDAGESHLGDMTFIISRGLGNHGMIPRIFNKPELVVIDLF